MEKIWLLGAAGISGCYTTIETPGVSTTKIRIKLKCEEHSGEVLGA